MSKYYSSTRNKQNTLNAKEAILKGFADDKGLFVLPSLGEEQIDLTKLSELSYQQIAEQVLTLLLPDFSTTEIQNAIQNAYTNSFDNDEITPLKAVDDFYVLELFHGPTSAFKDVGLQLLPELMKQSVANNQQVMILAATSGDTGTAALDGFKDKSQMGITVFYPDGGVSPVQQQQMLTTSGENTRVAAIDGNFDDAQTNVKKIFNDSSLKAKLGNNKLLSSANSINIGRLIPQIVYYFSAYKQLIQAGRIKRGDQVSFTVPTGNFGDVLAGYYAKKLGLPVDQLVVACNENNVLADFFATGIYNRNRPFFKTIAPSMDIQVSSNFERLLYYESGQDDQYIKALMDSLETTGQYQITSELLGKIKQEFACGYSTDSQIEAAIKLVFEKYGYLMDPHTASGYRVLRDEQKDQVPMILLSTASPYKFADAVSDALFSKHDDDVKENINKIRQATQVEIPKNLQAIWDKQMVANPTIEPSEMTDLVWKNIGEVFGDD
ncbi:threonine synthase [Fructilactobacillus vespulae]|uniref:threonine synthase n=1 Tax=Fructilactobacillus vespulae TaxID=1249630 RepID=UPI0039B486BB